MTCLICKTVYVPSLRLVKLNNIETIVELVHSVRVSSFFFDVFRFALYLLARWKRLEFKVSNRSNFSKLYTLFCGGGVIYNWGIDRIHFIVFGGEQIMNFKLKHLIFPVREECKLVIESVFPVQINYREQYSIAIFPFSGLRRYGLRNAEYTPTDEDEAFFLQRHTLTIEGEQLVMNITFPQEDCYVCHVFVGDVEVDRMEIYALEADLFAKNPYKGDNHLHTYMSDGVDSPMYMAAASCRNGYDYCVITDHKVYTSSLLARDFFAPTGVDFLVIPGEEVHSPDNPVHIINMGGDKSVNDWWRDHEDEYRAAVKEEMKKMTDPMNDEDRFAAAASQVMFDRVHEANGVAVLCHPNWILGNGFNEHEDITDYLFDHKRFDALELIAGGAYEVGTQMQLSYYNDRPNMPVLGNSDAHGCFSIALEPGNFTIVFANALDSESIKDSIRAGLAVAADANRFYGNYRLVKYAYFLQRHYFPEHKKSRNALGAHMLRMASCKDNTNLQLLDKIKRLAPTQAFASLRYTKKGGIQ